MGKLPQEIKGKFGPGVKSLVCTLKHVVNVSEPKNLDCLKSWFRNYMGRLMVIRWMKHKCRSCLGGYSLTWIRVKSEGRGLWNRLLLLRIISKRTFRSWMSFWVMARPSLGCLPASRRCAGFTTDGPTRSCIQWFHCIAKSLKCFGVFTGTIIENSRSTRKIQLKRRWRPYLRNSMVCSPWKQDIWLLMIGLRRPEIKTRSCEAFFD